MADNAFTGTTSTDPLVVTNWSLGHVVRTAESLILDSTMLKAMAGADLTALATGTATGAHDLGITGALSPDIAATFALQPTLYNGKAWYTVTVGVTPWFLAWDNVDTWWLTTTKGATTNPGWKRVNASEIGAYTGIGGTETGTPTGAADVTTTVCTATTTPFLAYMVGLDITSSGLGTRVITAYRSTSQVVVAGNHAFTDEAVTVSSSPPVFNVVLGATYGIGTSIAVPLKLAGLTSVRIGGGGQMFLNLTVTGTPTMVIQASGVGSSTSVYGLDLCGAGFGSVIINALSGAPIKLHNLTTNALELIGGTVRAEASVTTIAVGAIPLTMYSGTLLTLAALATTSRMNGGSLVIQDANIGETHIDGGQLTLNTGPSNTTGLIDVGSGGMLTAGNDPRAKTVSACTVRANGSIQDAYGVITWTTGIVLDGCTIPQVPGLNLGYNRTLNVT